MSRRVSLPGADELFRPTEAPSDLATVAAPRSLVAAPAPPPDSETPAEPPPRRSSGRVRHDEKITVYVTADELLDLEHTRLALRRNHGVAVDRGRIVREAIHLAMQDVEEHGDDSALVRRLRET